MLGSPSPELRPLGWFLIPNSPHLPPGRSTPIPRCVSTVAVLSLCQRVALERTGERQALGLPRRGEDALRGWRRHWGVFVGGGDKPKCPHMRHGVRGLCSLVVTVTGDANERSFSRQSGCTPSIPGTRSKGQVGVLSEDVPQVQVNKSQIQSLRRLFALGRGARAPLADSPGWVQGAFESTGVPFPLRFLVFPLEEGCRRSLYKAMCVITVRP